MNHRAEGAEQPGTIIVQRADLARRRSTIRGENAGSTVVVRR